MHTYRGFCRWCNGNKIPNKKCTFGDRVVVVLSYSSSSSLVTDFSFERPRLPGLLASHSGFAAAAKLEHHPPSG